MPDNWEMACVGTTNYSGASDPNGIGVSLMQSYLAGTPPTDIVNRPMLQVDPAGLHFNAMEAGTNYYLEPRYYSLEYKTNLLSEPWLGVPLCTNILAENQQITHTNLLPNASFYRFRAWFP